MESCDMFALFVGQLYELLNIHPMVFFLNLRNVFKVL